ncbi:Na/Pi symporter [Alteromonas sp. ASW11-19]|uniref:Na/Pi symporter n=1 Tax=Alteromonas salexigens TaxID=2982530 RepID=A0ABT2VW28_9ALTE|nr:Na/Pi symporter [Alteromonas salexigens]MCU7556049.1 Na/Pi symporter [Alteromonas salexigens]
MTSIHTLITVLGSLGLFLLGMVVMTDGLRQLAGDAIRRQLRYYTRSPLTGAVTGAFSTAVLQSSSAITVAVVGFVGAGLMSFSHALGVIFGANIGTTITGWLVLLFGFKIKLGAAALPLVFIGVLMRLLASGKLRAIGFVLAGFGLLFVGIASLQDSMAGLRTLLNFEPLPTGHIGQVLIIVGLGMLFTLVTQSSSAGVAATLTALYANMIDFEQGAALVIGMDVGTTITAAIATTGASVSAKRTGFSHVIYNLMTGLLAVLLITPFILVWEAVSLVPIEQHSEIALISFHSFFNLLGVMVILPFTHQFAALMRRLFPEDGDNIKTRLDENLLGDSQAALDTLQYCVHHTFFGLLSSLRTALSGHSATVPSRGNDIDDMSAFADRISITHQHPHHHARLVHLIHCLDHLRRVDDRLEEIPEFNEQHHGASIASQRELVITTLTTVHNNQAPGDWAASNRNLAELAAHLQATESEVRADTLHAVAQEALEIPVATVRLDYSRWLRRCINNLHRAMTHMDSSVQSVGDTREA